MRPAARIEPDPVSARGGHEPRFGQDQRLPTATWVDRALTPHRMKGDTAVHDSRCRTQSDALVAQMRTPLLAPAGTDPPIGAMLAELRDRVAAARPYNIGFPAAV